MLGFHKDYCLLIWFDLLKHWNFPYVKITTLPKCLHIKWWDVWDLLQNNRREVEGIQMKQNWLYFDNGWSWMMDMPRLITLCCLRLKIPPNSLGTFLVVQWLSLCGASQVTQWQRICLPMQGDAGDAVLIPRSGNTPWRRKCQPTPVFLPENCYGQRSLVGYSP